MVDNVLKEKRHFFLVVFFFKKHFIYLSSWGGCDRRRSIGELFAKKYIPTSVHFVGAVVCLKFIFK